jgi:hypothetical protein
MNMEEQKLVERPLMNEEEFKAYTFLILINYVRQNLCF